MSFEQDPYDREDEEIRKAFAEKDAEIERLKAETEACRKGSDKWYNQNQTQKAEINKLTATLFAMGSTIESRNVLIGENARSRTVFTINPARQGD